MSVPVRRKPIHQPILELKGRPTVVMLTVCTAQRKRILANDRAVELVIRAWRAADVWLVGRYVVLPDHIHLFCAPCDGHSWMALKQWGRFWTSAVLQSW